MVIFVSNMKVIVIEIKNLSIKEYFHKIKAY